MSSHHIILVGNGGHARSCIDVLETGHWNIYGLIARGENEVGSQVCGYPICGTDTELSKFISYAPSALVAIGHIKDCRPRIQAFNRIRAAGFQIPSIVSPFAFVSSTARIGPGTIVMPGAIICSGVTIGANCIINTQAVIDHDSSIGDHTHISTAATVNGSVRVGSRCFIGSKSAIIQEVSIGDDSIVGIGAIIRKDCLAGSKSL